MLRTATKGVALLAVFGLGLTACSSDSKPATPTKIRTLVMESNPVASFTDDFNPFDGKSFSSTENTNAFFYEPLHPARDPVAREVVRLVQREQDPHPHAAVRRQVE